MRDLSRQLQRQRTEEVEQQVKCPPNAYTQVDMVDAVLIYYLIHEFLESMELFNTLAVFSCEAADFDSQKKIIDYHPIMGLEWFLKSFFVGEKYQGLLPILLRFYTAAGRRVLERRRANGACGEAIEREELEELQRAIEEQMNPNPEFRGCPLVVTKKANCRSKTGQKKSVAETPPPPPRRNTRSCKSCPSNVVQEEAEDEIFAKVQNEVEKSANRSSHPQSKPIDLSKRRKSIFQRRDAIVSQLDVRMEAAAAAADEPIDYSRQPAPPPPQATCPRPDVCPALNPPSKTNSCPNSCPRKTTTTTRQPVDYEENNHHHLVQHEPEECPIGFIPDPALDRSSFLQRKRQNAARAKSMADGGEGAAALTRENVTFHELLEGRRDVREDFREKFLKNWKPAAPPQPAIVINDSVDEERTNAPKAGPSNARDDDVVQAPVEFGPMTHGQFRNYMREKAEEEDRVRLAKINSFLSNNARPRPKIKKATHLFCIPFLNP